jgi:hypothetical protein
MENNGTHYTVLVEVGTPAQTFAVVADTGSNSLIVPSCVCSDAGKCDKQDRCFRGTNTSSTFMLPGVEDDKLQVMMVTFGSGSVQAVRANDVVHVGGVQANMSDGILLMTDQALRLPGRFEGILGLGIPEQEQNTNQSSADQIMKARPRADARAIRTIAGNKSFKPTAIQTTTDEEIPDWLRDIIGQMGFGGEDGDAGNKISKNELQEEAHQPKGFLEQAGIDRFSMCFNHEGGGVLRLGDGVPEFQEELQNIGHMHWGVDFHGISVGEASEDSDALFCHPSKKAKGQQTACGLIPDSGTTAIMGPEAQISILLDGICDGWKRCSDNFTALQNAAKAASAAAAHEYGFDPWGIEESLNSSQITKGTVLQSLLADCASWLDEDGGLGDEGLPDLKFHIVGAEGKKQTLSIPGSDYIITMSQEDVKYSYQHIPGFGDIPVGVNHTGKFQQVCAPSVGGMEYKTEKNGDVWILGVPLFSGYSVGYDLKKLTMNFAALEDGECGTCKPSAGLVSSERKTFRGSMDVKRSRKLRKLSGPLRIPNIDVTRPL